VNLKEAAMIAVLKTGQWRPVRHDREVDAEVANTHGSDRRMGRFNKTLADAPEIQEVSQVINEARIYHYAHTLPWLDQGQRMLTAAMFPEYSAAMQVYQGRVVAAAKKVEENYPRIKQDARGKLNGLFKDGDYPPAWRILGRYLFKVAFYPVPDAQDFRHSLAAADLEQVRAETAAAIQEGVTKGMRDLYARLHELVKNLRDVLTKDKPRIYDTLVGNLAALCSMLPKLNLTQDPTLDQLKKDIEKDLTNHTPDDLRDFDEEERKKKADQADEILKKISQVLG
jgi:hypothetical protein